MDRPLYALASSLASILAVGAFAQLNTEPVAPHAQPEATYHGSEALPPLDARGGGGVVWSEDFGGGFPSGWALDDASGICPWRWSTDGSWGYFNGNNGTAGAAGIASTTAANGFLICDPDSANNVTYGQPSGTTYQYLSSYFTTTAIDLTGHPNVKLEFEQFFRFNNTPTLDVMVSNDGSNWTTWTVGGSVQPNQASPNAVGVSLNISGVAGDQPTVYIRIGWNARVYYWMIDDMRIVDAPDNDVKLNEVNYSEWFFDTANDFGALEYTVYPATQLRPFTFKGEFTNEGFLAQTGVTLDVEVRNAASTLVHDASAQLASLAPLTGDSIYTASWTPNASTDDYTVTFTVSADDPDVNPADNVLMKTYAVSPYVFARDRGSRTGRYDNGGDAYNLGNWFHIVNDGDVLYGIDVAIANETPVGVLITATLYDANRDPIAVTLEHEVTSADLNAAGGTTFVTLPFAPGDRPELAAGNDYLAMVNHYGGTDNLWTATSGVSLPQTSLIYDIPEATYFYVTATPMVRLNMDPAVGIASLDAAGPAMRIHPVPASEQVTINYQHANGALLDLFDAQGRVVWTAGPSAMRTAVGTLTLNTSGLLDGVYMLCLTSTQGRVTSRLMIAH